MRFTILKVVSAELAKFTTPQSFLVGVAKLLDAETIDLHHIGKRHFQNG